MALNEKWMFTINNNSFLLFNKLWFIIWKGVLSCAVIVTSQATVINVMVSTYFSVVEDFLLNVQDKIKSQKEKYNV